MDYVVIENLTDKPLWPRLNSGTCVHIDPNSHTAPVAASEVKDNAKLMKLSEQKVIRVYSDAGGAKGRGAHAKDRDAASDEAEEKRDAGKRK